MNKKTALGILIFFSAIFLAIVLLRLDESARTELAKVTEEKTQRQKPQRSELVVVALPGIRSQVQNLPSPKGDTQALPASERSAVIRRSIDLTYGKAMRGLGLRPEEVERLRQLLIEKDEATYIAGDVASEAPNRAVDDKEILSVATRANVDEEIRQAFGDEKYGRIKAMIESSTHLLMQQMTYEPALKKAGIAELDPGQTYRLAVAMRDSYGNNNSSFNERARAADPGSGLTQADDRVLKEAASFLSEGQIETLKTVFATRNHTIQLRNKNKP